jgi:hypothetical protein
MHQNEHELLTFLLLHVRLLACHDVGFNDVFRLCLGERDSRFWVCFTIGVVGLRLCCVLSAGEGLTFFCCCQLLLPPDERTGQVTPSHSWALVPEVSTDAVNFWMRHRSFFSSSHTLI